MYLSVSLSIFIIYYTLVLLKYIYLNVLIETNLKMYIMYFRFKTFKKKIGRHFFTIHTLKLSEINKSLNRLHELMMTDRILWSKIFCFLRMCIIFYWIEPNLNNWHHQINIEPSSSGHSLQTLSWYFTPFSFQIKISS